MSRKLYTLAGVLAACFVAATVATASASLVRTTHNTRLGATILVGANGHTLYDLSVERNGRFICTTPSCLAFWHPLVVAKGVKPSGTVQLGTIKRPDGRIQVTFKGAPLYSFVQDVKAGQVKGEGFKDVGVWHAAATTAVKTPAPSPSPSPYPSGGNGGY